ncbi:MAG: hypothetical protein EA377_06245 [Phycisphaerales bacterium]|nr:MAG: hypothetical protein EA377_06245 [Phycisphaerales bacterium]
MSSDSTDKTTALRTPSSARSWRRVGLTLGLIIGGLILAAWWTVTRSWFLVMILTPQLENRLGGEVIIGSAAWSGFDRIELRDVRLRVDWPGDAGELLHAESVRIQADRSWLRRNPRLASVELRDVLVRVAEDVEAGRFSVQLLSHPPREEEDLRPPRIELIRAAIEYGVRQEQQFEPSGRMYFSGRLNPVADEQREYRFVLHQVDQRGSIVEDGLTARGQWDAQSFAYHATIDGFGLSDSIYAMSPSIVRQWWEKMALEGQLRDAMVSWDPEELLDVRFDVEEVGLTLPVPAEQLWARYRDGHITDETYTPRMRVESGSIRLRQDELALDVRGQLVTEEERDQAQGVPYHVVMSFDHREDDRARADGWADYIVNHAPFMITVESEPEASDGEEVVRNAIDLPRQIAEILERFQVRDWALSTRVVMQRLNAIEDEDGNLQPRPITTHGELKIHEGRGQYDRFAYPLDDLDGQIVFTENSLMIEYLRGVGPSGAKVRIDGEVHPLSATPAVDLNITATNVPVDDHLRHALPDSFDPWFDNLMDQRAVAKLHDADMLDHDRLQADAERRREESLSRWQQLRKQNDLSDSQRSVLRRLEHTLASTDRELQSPPFEVGGTVDVEVQIQRTEGPGDRTQTFGEATVRSLGLVYERFPYPFQVTAGRIRWAPGMIELLDAEGGQEGLTFQLPRGGVGSIGGTIEMTNEAGEQQQRPDLRLSLEEGEQINDLLLAAIPLTPADSRAGDVDRWPGQARSDAARLLQSVNLRGVVTAEGFIGTGEDGRVHHDIRVQMADAEATPTEELADFIGAAGLFWPENFIVRDLSGELRVLPERIELIEINGRHITGDLYASGAVTFGDENDDEHPVETELTVGFDELELGKHLINLIPDAEAKRARAYWNQYQPEGMFNAGLVYRARGPNVEPLQISVSKINASVQLESDRVGVHAQEGFIRLRDGQVAFEDLVARFQHGEIDEGRLALAGTYGLAADDEQLNVDGSWDDLRIESPLTTEIIRTIGAEHLLEETKDWQPTGRVNVGFFYRSACEEQPADYRLRVQPTTIGLTIDGNSLSMEFDSDGSVLVLPGQLRLRDLTGRFADDDGRFGVSGQVGLENGTDALFQIDYVGALRSASMKAVLPDAVNTVLDDLEFTDGERVIVRGATLAWQRDAAVGDTTGAPWQIDFLGRVRAEGASLSVGVPLTGVHAVADLNVRAWEDGPTDFSMTLEADEFRLYGRRLTDFHAANVRLDREKQRVQIPEFRAEMHEGVVTGEGFVGVNANRDYEIRVDIVDVSLKDFIDDFDPADESAAPRAERSGREREGRLYGGMRLSGQRDDPGSRSRSGRGVVRGVGDNLEVLPLVLQISQVLQLTAPFAGTINHANAEFYIRGDRLVFERILFENVMGDFAPLQLIGAGEMTLSTLALRTTFRTRSGWAILRDLFGTVGDQLYLVEVTGTLLEPKARVVPLPGLTQADSDSRP